MKKILLVEDNPVQLQHLERIVSDMGYMVVTAANGEEGVKMAIEQQPALVLMDVNMPLLDGFGAARKLSQEASTKNIPVVFVTAKDQKADRVFAQMLGAKGFVTKPYTSEDIAQHLQRHT